MLFLTPIFNHNNILKYANRPFTDTATMNLAMEENWNSVVSPEDRVYHLGDFVFENNAIRDTMWSGASILSRLNGYKILIRGNHDPTRKKCYKMGWDEVYNTYFYPGNGDPSFDIVQYVFVHKPAIMNPGQFLCGHVHDQWQVFGNNLNMSVEVWNYTPATIDQVEERIESLRSDVHDTYGFVNLVDKNHNHIYMKDPYVEPGSKY